MLREGAGLDACRSDGAPCILGLLKFRITLFDGDLAA